MNWSKQQEQIFAWFREGHGNLVVRARVGTGKTTTIIQAISYAPETKILMAAFNKKIALELGERLAHPGAEAKTLHSLGYGFVRRYWENLRPDGSGKRATEIARMASKGSPDKLLGEVVNLMSKLKAVSPMLGADRKRGNLEDRIQAIDVADRFGISVAEEWKPDGFDMDWLADSAVEGLRIGSEYRDGTIDFDDMVWLPVRNGWVRPFYDMVVIDEAQDMNRSQILLAMQACKDSGRIAVIGDDRQAIYGFRGADSGSIDRLRVALEATELGLTTTYRCGKQIVARAQRLVPDFEAAASNAEGKISRAKEDDCVAKAEPGDFVISRTNAPLVSICLRLLRAGKRANIEGKDIGRGLIALVRACNKGPAKSFRAFTARLQAKIDADVAKAQLRGEKGEATIERLYDQHETLEALMDGLASADELISRIENLFADMEGKHSSRVVLSSVHKAKGLEADTVWLLEGTFFSLRGKIPGWADAQEEANIEYVAITRAKSHLVWVEREENR